MSRIILTDIHGCYKTMLALIAKLPPGIPLTFAGDMIDRGPGSAQVMDFIKNGGHDAVIGNHEVMMLDELRFDSDENGEYYEIPHFMTGIWLMNGGASALNSYKDATGEPSVAKLKEHFAWLETLPYFIEYPELVDAHGQTLLVSHSSAAEVWKSEPDRNSQRFKMGICWSRPTFPSKIKGKFNVFGHTINDRPIIKEWWANIDTGACRKKAPFGRLTALQFPEMITYEQDYIDDEQDS